jgi:type IV pilus assembly protein PilE
MKGIAMTQPPLPPRLPNNAGFTLMELLITVAIVGILTKLALPSYQEYITRGKIPDALATLSAKQLSIEQFYLDNRTYVGAPGCNSDTASSSYFNFSCTNQAAGTYTAQAVGKNSMAGFSYALDQTSAKWTIAVPTAAGWTLPTTNNCWVTRKGGVC